MGGKARSQGPGRPDGAAVRAVLVTLNGHLAAAFDQARASLARDLPSLDLRLHVAADWAAHPDRVLECRADLQGADVVIVTQIFQEDMAREILPVLAERREQYEALLCAMCVPELTRLTRLGRFSMHDEDRSAWSPMALLRKLRGSRTDGRSAGERQMAMLRLLPAILKYIPGAAQDARVYFQALRYWLAGTPNNVANMVRMVVQRYARGLDGARVVVGDVEEAEEVGRYVPGGRRDGETAGRQAGRVGVLVGRSYVLAGNTAHYDALIDALEARGLEVVAAYASALDARPAIDRFMRDAQGRPTIDALVSLTGFSLVGGPAYNDRAAAEEALCSLDVPYLCLQSLEFQAVEEWQADPRGLNPLQATLSVALPELDGALAGVVYGGRSGGAQGMAAMPVTERVERVAERVARLVALRRKPKRDRKVAIVLFNFPPNAGNTGSAAYLAVFPSLQRVLSALKEDGYRVQVPASADALREMITGGNAALYGAPANVHHRIPVDEHVRKERHLGEIERTWGPAPGKQLTDGRSLFVMGCQLGNVFVGVQPAFGWEGDPMRLLFEGNFAPTHAFSAFYRWLRDDHGTDVVLHFGTHGALEFMPGKQVGLTGNCWPERLIGALPNVYLYASNNSSEGTLAKRRGGATLVSYLTPPIARAGVYKELSVLKDLLGEAARAGTAREADGADERARGIQAQAAALDLCRAEPVWAPQEVDVQVARVREKLLELEYSLIPLGLHVVGEVMGEADRASTVDALRESGIEGADLERAARLLAQDHEIPGLLRGLDGRYVPPAPGGDLIRTPAVLPTGRNLYAFDPYKVPSGTAVRDGRARATQLLERHAAGGAPLPETVAMVLWGTDNMKSEGTPIAMALALMGAVPRFDGVGRLVGARLLDLATLGRPRIDVVLSLSGIFRDLLPLQVKLLAEAALLAAQADEPVEQNFVRKHALAHQQALGCDLATAALRVFGNADGAYGSNVNLLLDSGRWSDEDDLAEQFVQRKGYGYGADGRATAHPALLQQALRDAAVSFQNLDSVELGTTDIDQYVESLGGMNRVIARVRGAVPAAYIGDHTGPSAKVRTVEEQVALETRTRLLNPKWFEAQLRYGYEGVRNLAGHVTTTFGWSATGSAVPAWVYTEVTGTFVLDPAMRERLAALNPTAMAGMAQRLLEANERGYWTPDDATLNALRDASADLEDRLEGVATETAA